MFYPKRIISSEISNFFDQIIDLLKTLKENGMKEEEVKKNLKDFLLRHFEQKANADTTSNKVDRNKEKLTIAINNVEDTMNQLNQNLIKMQGANDAAQAVNEEARKFKEQADELASLTAGNNLMIIVILVIAGLLLGVVVFANLYATIHAPLPASPPPRKSLELGPSQASVSKNLVDYRSSKNFCERQKILKQFGLFAFKL